MNSAQGVRVRAILPAHQAYQVKKWAEAAAHKQQRHSAQVPYWQQIPRGEYWRGKFLRALTNYQSGVSSSTGRPASAQAQRNREGWLAHDLQELGGLAAIW